MGAGEAGGVIRLDTTTAITPSVNELEELLATFALYQGMLLLEDEPFEVKRAWIETLNLKGILFVENGVKKIKITCHLGQEVLWLQTPLPKNNAHRSNKSRVLVSSHTLTHWHNIRPESSDH